MPATDLSFAGSAKPRNRQFDLAQCCAHSRRLVSIMLEKSHELARLNQRIADIQRCSWGDTAAESDRYAQRAGNCQQRASDLEATRPRRMRNAFDGHEPCSQSQRG